MPISAVSSGGRNVVGQRLGLRISTKNQHTNRVTMLYSDNWIVLKIRFVSQTKIFQIMNLLFEVFFWKHADGLRNISGFFEIIKVLVVRWTIVNSALLSVIFSLENVLFLSSFKLSIGKHTVGCLSMCREYTNTRLLG